jgi:hypothetical protein
MIRVYLDWNVISNLKRPENIDLFKFILQNKRKLLFPYTQAHFTDLMKSHHPENKYYPIDLEMLEFLAENHHLRWGKDRIEPLLGTPTKYFAETKDNESIAELLNIEKLFNEFDDTDNEFGIKGYSGLMKSLLKLQPTGIDITDENKDILSKMFPNLKNGSTIWDMMKDLGPMLEQLLHDGNYYKDLRNTISESGFKLEPNSGQWSYNDVINNIDEFLKSNGLDMTYLEFIESTFKHRKKSANQYEYYTTAYLMLDMIGYKVDKLPKPTDNMQNIQADGDHSFYAAYCDYFAASDKKLRIKSQVLYNEFDVPTKIIEPHNLISELSEVIDNIENKDNLINEAIGFCRKEYFVKDYTKDDDEIEVLAFKLPKYYFNFFNYVIYRHYPKQKVIVLSFKRVFKNFSDFVYYTESESILDNLCYFFGNSHMTNYKEQKRKFVYEGEELNFDWSIENGFIRIDKDEEYRRIRLNYILSVE